MTNVLHSSEVRAGSLFDLQLDSRVFFALVSPAGLDRVSDGSQPAPRTATALEDRAVEEQPFECNSRAERSPAAERIPP